LRRKGAANTAVLLRMKAERGADLIADGLTEADSTVMASKMTDSRTAFRTQVSLRMAFQIAVDRKTVAVPMTVGLMTDGQRMGVVQTPAPRRVFQKMAVQTEVAPRLVSRTLACRNEVCPTMLYLKMVWRTEAVVTADGSMKDDPKLAHRPPKAATTVDRPEVCPKAAWILRTWAARREAFRTEVARAAADQTKVVRKTVAATAVDLTKAGRMWVARRWIGGKKVASG
jgi:hypothetical protein